MCFFRLIVVSTFGVTRPEEGSVASLSRVVFTEPPEFRHHYRGFLAQHYVPTALPASCDLVGVGLSPLLFSWYSGGSVSVGVLFLAHHADNWSSIII